MRFLVDECTGLKVAAWLRQQQQDVFSVYEQLRGASDDAILTKAHDENWILITNDSDFGEKIYRERKPHKGIIFLRLEDERAVNKIAVLKRLLEQYSDSLSNQFVVVTETKVRFAKATSLDLEAAYRPMAQDEAREAEALEFSETTFSDVAEEDGIE
jgi:predicted nuclease of predicted toxin-antitoxin system